MSKIFTRLLKGFAVTSAFAFSITTYSLNTKEGDVYSWGYGRNGQLGLGSQSNISFPQLINNIKFINIQAKKNFSAGITKDGKLYTWGKNRGGALGHYPSNINVLIPRQVEIDEKIIDVGCGYQHICALTAKGQVYIWGLEQARSSFRTIGTTEPQKKVQTVKPHKLQISNIKQISGSGDYITLVNNQGKVFLMGALKIRGRNGKQAQNSLDIVQLDIQRITRVQSGLNYSLALNDQGKVFVWGNNTFGQLGIGSLKNCIEPQQLQIKQKIVDISCGDNFSGAVTENGQVYTWGFGNEGQLGHEDKSDLYVPRKISSLKDKVKSISCGGAHTALLMRSGKLFMMGRGRQGQLGREQKDEGSAGYSLKIKQVQQLPPNKNIKKVVCGNNHTLALLQELK